MNIYGVGLFSLLLCSMILSADIAYSNNDMILFNAKTEREISAWGKKIYGSVKTERIKAEDKDIFILFGDNGSGTARIVIYLYLLSKENKSWDLLMIRFTNTSKVTAFFDKQGKNFKFTSKAGDVLFDIPLSGLNLNFNQNEQ